VAVAVDPALLDPEEVVVPDVGVEVSVSPLVDLAALVRDRWPTTAVLLGAERPDPEEADTRTLLDLLELRRLAEDLGIPLPRLVVHLRDDRHEPLVDLPGPDDLLLSESLGSQFIAQLVGQPERRHVLLQLYAEGDPSIRLLPADLLGLAGDRSMGEVVRACSAAGLLAIGWRRASTRGGELVLNAHVDERVVLAPDDEIVVIT
jgi:hypothetical protein